jgi:hypothetical protein
VSKKKSRTSLLAGEPPASADGPFAGDLPTSNGPLLSTDPEPALCPEAANAAESSFVDVRAPLHRISNEGSRGILPPAGDPPAIFDLALAPQAGSPIPVAMPAPEPVLGTLVERIEKLEKALARVQDLQGIDELGSDRAATHVQSEKAPCLETASPMFANAAALMDAGKQLLPSLVRPDASPAGPSLSHPPRPGTSPRMWLVWDAIAEARVIFRMYVDPRWSLSWMARMAPPVLLAAFVLIHYWMPFAIVPIIGPIVEKAGELVIGFLLFKVLAYESRRYRQTAPDLPPSLRL